MGGAFLCRSEKHNDACPEVRPNGRISNARPCRFFAIPGFPLKPVPDVCYRGTCGNDNRRPDSGIPPCRRYSGALRLAQADKAIRLPPTTAPTTNTKQNASPDRSSGQLLSKLANTGAGGMLTWPSHPNASSAVGSAVGDGRSRFVGSDEKVVMIFAPSWLPEVVERSRRRPRRQSPRAHEPRVFGS